jgi:homoaconitase/3-isopropylmalate dehydratase large subunit
LPSGQTQLFIGLHLIHEVTSPQAFAMLRERELKVMYPQRTVATVDHIVPTENQARPFLDTLAEEMMQALEQNCQELRHSLLQHWLWVTRASSMSLPRTGVDPTGHDHCLRR